MNNYKLKLDLFYHGIKITDEAKQELNIDDNITSGIIIKTNGIYAKAIQNEKSQYILDCVDKHFIISNQNKKYSIRIHTFLPNKNFLNLQELACDCVTVQADRIIIHPKIKCVNKNKYIRQIDYCFNIALKQNNIRHALILADEIKEDEFQYLTDIFTHFATKYNGFPIDAMLTPRGFDSLFDTDDYEKYIKYLKKIGINGLHINIDLYNEEYRKAYMPEKTNISLKNYMTFIKKAVKIFEKNKVHSSIIVGIEPMEDTLKGVELICKAGGVPVLIPYSSLTDSNIKKTTPEYMLEVRTKAEIMADKYNVILGPMCEACKYNTI